MKVKLIAITVAAAVALTGIWFVALWSPQGGKIDDAKAEQAAAETQAADLQARLTRLKKLEANKDQLDADKALFSALIPDTDQLDAFILDINQKAKESGIEFVSIAPSQPAPEASAGPVPVALSIQANGDYFALLRFMEKLRDGQRLVTIDNFTLSGGEGGQLSAAIAGRMFVRGAGAPPPAPAPAPTEGA